MDEPTHSNENRFWDDVADWLLDGPEEQDAASEAMDDIESMLRDLRDDLEP